MRRGSRTQGMGLYGHTIPYHIKPCRKWTREIKIRAWPRPNQTFSPDAKVYFVSLCSILLFRVVLLRWLSFWVCSQPRIDSHFLSFSGFHRPLIVCSALLCSLFSLPFCERFICHPFFCSMLFVYFLLASFPVHVCVCECVRLCMCAQCGRTHRSLLLCIILYTWIVYRLPVQSTRIMAELSLFKQHVIRTTARFMCIFRAAIWLLTHFLSLTYDSPSQHTMSFVLSLCTPHSASEYTRNEGKSTKFLYFFGKTIVYCLTDKWSKMKIRKRNPIFLCICVESTF